MNLTNIENKVNELDVKVTSVKAKISLLEEQYAKSMEAIEDAKVLDIVNKKSLELLNLIQKATKNLIQDLFEGVITKALSFIHQSDDYKFELEFSKHGNNPKLSFLLKTPDMQESHDIMGTRAGGSKDIIALALRFVLLEISKNKGFLFLDEAFKRLDNPETIKKAIEFIIETQKDTGRQIFLITHKDEIIESVPNPIILKRVDT